MSPNARRRIVFQVLAVLVLVACAPENTPPIESTPTAPGSDPRLEVRTRDGIVIAAELDAGSSCARLQLSQGGGPVIPFSPETFCAPDDDPEELLVVMSAGSPGSSGESFFFGWARLSGGSVRFDPPASDSALSSSGWFVATGRWPDGPQIELRSAAGAPVVVLRCVDLAC